MPNNPKGHAGNGEHGLRPFLKPGEGYIRETASYILDYANFCKVPPTTIVHCEHTVFHYPRGQNGERPSFPKLGSLQKFIPSSETFEDISPSKVGVLELQKIALLDMRLLNCDRNASNILVVRKQLQHQHASRIGSGPDRRAGRGRRSGSLSTASEDMADDAEEVDILEFLDQEDDFRNLTTPSPLQQMQTHRSGGSANKFSDTYDLIPIDHGYCLPTKLQIDEFDWAWFYCPHVAAEVAPEIKEYMFSLDFEALLAELTQQISLSEDSLFLLRVTHQLLVEGIRAGLSLRDIAALIARTQEDVPSPLEAAIAVADENAVRAIEMRSERRSTRAASAAASPSFLKSYGQSPGRIPLRRTSTGGQRQEQYPEQLQMQQQGDQKRGQQEQGRDEESPECKLGVVHSPLRPLSCPLEAPMLHMQPSTLARPAAHYAEDSRRAAHRVVNSVLNFEGMEAQPSYRGSGNGYDGSYGSGGGVSGSASASAGKNHSDGVKDFAKLLRDKMNKKLNTVQTHDVHNNTGVENTTTHDVQTVEENNDTLVATELAAMNYSGETDELKHDSLVHIFPNLGFATSHDQVLTSGGGDMLVRKDAIDFGAGIVSAVGTGTVGTGSAMDHEEQEEEQEQQQGYTFHPGVSLGLAHMHSKHLHARGGEALTSLKSLDASYVQYHHVHGLKQQEQQHGRNGPGVGVVCPGTGHENMSASLQQRKREQQVQHEQSQMVHREIVCAAHQPVNFSQTLPLSMETLGPGNTCNTDGIHSHLKQGRVGVVADGEEGGSTSEVHPLSVWGGSRPVGNFIDVAVGSSPSCGSSPTSPSAAAASSLSAAMRSGSSSTSPELPGSGRATSSSQLQRAQKVSRGSSDENHTESSDRSACSSGATSLSARTPSSFGANTPMMAVPTPVSAAAFAAATAAATEGGGDCAGKSTELEQEQAALILIKSAPGTLPQNWQKLGTFPTDSAVPYASSNQHRSLSRDANSSMSAALRSYSSKLRTKHSTSAPAAGRTLLGDHHDLDHDDAQTDGEHDCSAESMLPSPSSPMMSSPMSPKLASVLAPAAEIASEKKRRKDQRLLRMQQRSIADDVQVGLALSRDEAADTDYLGDGLGPLTGAGAGIRAGAGTGSFPVASPAYPSMRDDENETSFPMELSIPPCLSLDSMPRVTSFGAFESPPLYGGPDSTGFGGMGGPRAERQLAHMRKERRRALASTAEFQKQRLVFVRDALLSLVSKEARAKIRDGARSGTL